MCSCKSLVKRHLFMCRKSSSGSKLETGCVVGGHRAARLLELCHPKISPVPSAPLSKHWPQLAAKAGQEFIFISWNLVDLKSLLNVNFPKMTCSSVLSCCWDGEEIIESITWAGFCPVPACCLFLPLPAFLYLQATLHHIETKIFLLLFIWAEKKLSWWWFNPVPLLCFFSLKIKNNVLISVLMVVAIGEKQQFRVTWRCWLRAWALNRCLSLCLIKNGTKCPSWLRV